MQDSNNSPLAVILLAGMGSRLNRPHPKSLTSLQNGETILSRQFRVLKSFGLDICCVVGFKKDLIMEAVPDAVFFYNSAYDTTNTSKSLLCALRHIRDRDVLWLNGDVVFTEEIISRVLEQVGSAVAVNNERVGDEEVKYTVGDDGRINAISKQVPYALGEALGINKISSEYLEEFCQRLEAVNDGDYFERAMELMINEGLSIFSPVDVSQLDCIEVDFEEDLERARSMLKGSN